MRTRLLGLADLDAAFLRFFCGDADLARLVASLPLLAFFLFFSSSSSAALVNISWKSLISWLETSGKAQTLEGGCEGVAEKKPSALPKKDVNQFPAETLSVQVMSVGDVERTNSLGTYWFG